MNTEPSCNTAYPDRLVAFVDILGFKDLVRGSRDNALATIRSIDAGLKHVLDCFGLGGDPGWISARLFSDCICLSCEDSHWDLFALLRELAFLQFHLACNGMFVRGGLACGPHFENERMIFSEALVDAYELETRAVEPRIIIDGRVRQKIAEATKAGARMPYVVSAPDGEVSIDYLDFFREELEDLHIGQGEVEEILAAHRDALTAAVAGNGGRPRVLSKLRWLASYHNFKCADLVPRDECEDWPALLVAEGLFPAFGPVWHEDTAPTEVAT